VKTKWFGSWRTNFLAGLAVVMPAVISIAVVLWLFGTVANFTDMLLFFLPRQLTHQADGAGPLHWYWSVVAFLLTLGLISMVGLAARHYVGRKLIEFGENLFLKVPLLNKVYLALKQINEAFATSKKSAFKTVVLVQFPRPGVYSLGFITSEQHAEVQAKTSEHVLCVFVPTTPNPTTGFLVLVPEKEIVKLEMSVADAIKFIISLGTVSPEFAQPGTAPAVSLPPSAAKSP
jgi:uncharacterized membrane protein